MGTRIRTPSPRRSRVCEPLSEFVQPPDCCGEDVLWFLLVLRNTTQGVASFFQQNTGFAGLSCRAFRFNLWTTKRHISRAEHRGVVFSALHIFLAGLVESHLYQPIGQRSIFNFRFARLWLGSFRPGAALAARAFNFSSRLHNTVPSGSSSARGCWVSELARGLQTSGRLVMKQPAAAPRGLCGAPRSSRSEP